MDNEQDTLIIFDVETTGFIPGVHSVIALGAVSYRDGVEIGSFYGAMKEFKGSIRDAETMAFWKKNREEWDKIVAIQEEPSVVMNDFADWCADHEGPLTLAANPACFDAAWLWWYLYRYTGPDTVTQLFRRHHALDVRSYIAAVLNVPYSKAERKLLPPEWAEEHQYTHNALDDARQLGAVLKNLMKANANQL